MKTSNLVIFIFLLILNSNADPIYYRIINLDGNPGIYFERINTLKYINNYKNLVFILDIESIEGTLFNLLSKIPNINSLCEDIQEACKIDSSAEIKLKNELEEIRGIYNKGVNKLKFRLFDQSLSTNEIDTYIKSYLLNNSKPHEDSIYIPNFYEEQINKLNNDISQLDLLIRNITNNKSYTLEEFITIYVYWVNTTKSYIDELKIVINEFNNIIDSVNNNKISNELSPIDLLEEFLIREDYNLNYIKGNLEKILSLKFNYFQGKLVIVILIPILDEDTYTLYKIYSLPIIQEKCSKSIKVDNSHVALRDDKNVHVLLDSHDLQKCIIVGKILICPLPNKFILEPSCEKELLTSPNYKYLNLCTFEDKDPYDYWQRLSDKGWLYSLKQEMKLNIICSNRTALKIQLNGLGILQLTKPCKAKTEKFELVGSEYIEISHIYKSKFRILACPNNYKTNNSFPILIILLFSILFLIMFSVLFIFTYFKSKPIETTIQNEIFSNYISHPSNSYVSYEVPKYYELFKPLKPIYDIPKPPKPIYDIPKHPRPINEMPKPNFVFFSNNGSGTL